MDFPIRDLPSANAALAYVSVAAAQRALHTAYSGFKSQLKRLTNDCYIPTLEELSCHYMEVFFFFSQELPVAASAAKWPLVVSSLLLRVHSFTDNRRK